MSNHLFDNRLYLTAFGVAFATCLMLTPVVRNLARRWRIVDQPDMYRKLHATAIPLGGGVAIMLSFLLALGVVAALSDSQQFLLAHDIKFVAGLVAAAVTICGVGIIDDRYGLRGRQKLLGQLIAATGLVCSGLVIPNIAIFGFELELGLLSIPFTYFWLLGAINALNFLDGSDGLATSVGIVLSLAIAGMAVLTQHTTEAFLACAMAGGLVAFLVYNRPPASIFLGDAGSMFIGLILGALAIRGSFKGPATAALAAPTAIWAIPILDACMAILRRKLTGRSIYATDRGHIHHTLQRHGLGDSRTVIAIGVLCACTALGALASIPLHNEFLAYGSVLVVVAILIASRVFGHNEFHLLLRRAKNLFFSFAPRGETQSAAVPLGTRLQGNHQWEELWETLTAFADRFDLSAVELNVHLPAIHEDYHAKWHRRDVVNQEVWHSDIPLVADAVTVGRLRISGACKTGSACMWMGELIAGLKPFETHLIELVSDATTGHHSGGEGLAVTALAAGKSTDDAAHELLGPYQS